MVAAAKAQGMGGARSVSTGSKGKPIGLKELEDATELLWPAKKKRNATAAAVKSEAEDTGSKKVKPTEVKEEDAPAVTTTGAVTKKVGKPKGLVAEVEDGMSVKAKKAPAKKKAVPVKEEQGEDESNEVKRVVAKDALGRVTLKRLSSEPPKGWREIYDLVWELRKERDAPVDWAGSESLGTNPDTKEINEFHT